MISTCNADAMSCKNNKVRFEASFLMHVVPRPIVVREKKPCGKNRRSLAWSEGKSQGKFVSLVFGQNIVDK
mgnify:CR=1 FL=1